MKKLAVVAVVLTVTGCTRDLELPGKSAFTLSALPATVAPRQTATLTATGGTGALSIGFDAGGKLSGDDATVVMSGDGTATYQAGQNGSTQDTIVVRDASGAERRVILTVTARVSITPQIAAAAPGGTLTFTASGGKAPYAFTTTGAGVAAQSATTTRYTAGTTGDVDETVTVSDATGDPAASATATIRVGTKLTLYRPSPGQVAPNEEVTVIAFGGRASYTFGPSCASVAAGQDCFPDTSKGLFKVGSAGGRQATATVTDANGQGASLLLDVGPALAAALAAPIVRPELANRIVASGGKGPYAFRFARHGNHSGGTVDAIAGGYVPGRSPGALDRLEVADATGTVTAVSGVVPVGPIEISTGRDGDRCVAGDYDGDGTEDLAFLFRGMSLLEVSRIATDPLYRTYYVGNGFMFPAAFADDFDRDRRAELHFVGSRSGGPTYGSGDLGYWVLDPDMTGLFGNPDGMMTSPFTCNLGTPYGENVAGAHYDYLLTDRSDGCAANSLRRIQWVNGAPALSSCSPPIANFAALGWATALVAGDFTGDGSADFAWLASASSTDALYANTWNTPGPIYHRYTSAGTFADGGSLVLPAGTIFEGLGNGEQSRMLRVPAPPFSGQKEGLLVRLLDASGQGVIAFAKVVTGQQLEWTYKTFNPFPGGGVASLALYTPSPGGWPLAVAFAGTSGGVAVFDPWAADPTLTMGRGEAVFPVAYGCSVDADADGFPDFALGGSGSNLAAVLWGDGWGGMGTRPRLATGGFGGAGGDLDGDGLVDVVVPRGTELTAMFGDAGQLGWSETSLTTLPVATGAVARFVDQGMGARAPRDSVFFQGLDGDYYLVRTLADGTFEPQAHLTTSSAPGYVQAVPSVTHTWLLPADLGGAPGADAFGPDLIAPRNDNYGHSWIHVLLRPNETTVYEYMSPVVGDYRSTGGLIDKTHGCAYAPVRTGTSRAIASLCSYEVPSGQPAAAWRVRGWPLFSGSATWYESPWVNVGTSGANAGAPGTETDVTALGEFGGKAYFLVATDRLLVAVVDPGANALSPAGWTVTTTQLTTSRRTWPYLAQLVDLDGDGDLDAVVGGQGPTVILWNTGTASAPVFTYSASTSEVRAAGYPVAVGALGFVPGTSTPAKPSLVLGGMAGNSLQLVSPNGAGVLR